jgi:hypothetical protein
VACPRLGEKGKEDDCKTREDVSRLPMNSVGLGPKIFTAFHFPCTVFS